MAYLILFSLMALAVIESAALSKPILPSLNTTAITPPHLTFDAWLNTNLSKALVPHGHPICTDDQQWQLPGDSGVGGYLGACHIALQELGNKEIISSVPCRFISATSVGRFQDPIVETPKRYTYTLDGFSCTFVVAILDDFRPRATAVLPGAPPGPFQRTVISNWLEVYAAAQNLLLECFTAIPHFGYVTLRRQNLGVFFWATESIMNGYLPPYGDLGANTPTVETE